MEKEKVVTKYMELPLDDGTGEIVDKLAKQRDELAKTASKEFEDRAKLMDEVNNAKEAKPELRTGDGKVFKVKNVNEKLTLDESDDRQLNEAYDDTYDELVHKLFDAMHKVLSKTYLGDMPLEDVLDAVDEATMHLEEIMMEDDNGGTYVEESLDEALPRDLAKVYKENPFLIGSGNQLDGFNGIKRSSSVRGVPTALGNYSTPRVDVDFENSSYKAITPEEALQLKKEGKVANLRIIFDGQLVAYNEEGKPIYKATSRWNSDENKYKKNGRYVEHTTQLPFKVVLERADKIYYAEEKPANKDLQAARAENPESLYYKKRNTSWYPHDWGDSNITNYVRNCYRGSRLNRGAYVMYEINNLKNIIDSEKDSIESLKQGLAEIKQNKEGLDQETIDRRIEQVTDEIARRETRIKRCNYDLKREKQELQDYKAYVRNLDSKINLEGVVKEFFRLKYDYNKANDELTRANDQLERVKSQGSPQTTERKRELEKAKNELRELNARIAKLELYLEDADEDNQAELNKVSGVVDNLTNTVANLKARLQSIKPNKQEELDSEAGEQLEEAKVTVDLLNGYKPWSGAVDTYNRIEEAGKLDELDSLIEELYPEGIDETQLNDILWFESDWLYDSLGIAEE